MELNKIEGVSQLSNDELVNTDGGFWPIILLAGEIYAVTLTLAYATGYTVGTVEKYLE